MALVVYSTNSLSTAAYTKTANLVSGTYEFIGKGRLNLAARGSATGMNVSLSVGGIFIIDDQPIVAFGAAGSLSQVDHAICSQMVSGGRVILQLRNTTAGALTTDVLLTFDPM